MSKLLNSAIASAVIGTTAVGATNIEQGSCYPLSNVTPQTEVIQDIKSDYQNIVKDITVCNEEGTTHTPTIHISSAGDIKKYGNKKTDKKMDRLKGDRKDFVVDAMSTLTTNYNVSKKDMDKLYKDVYKLGIYKAKDNVEATTRAVEDILKGLTTNKVIKYNGSTSEVINPSDISNLGSMLGVNTDTSLSNYNTNLELNNGSLEKSISDLDNRNNQLESDIHRNTNFMLNGIEKALNLVSKGKGDKNDLSQKIKVFQDYKQGKQTFLSGKTNSEEDSRITELLNRYNSI